MKTRISRFGWMTVLVALGLSCGGSDGGLTQTEFCKQKAAKECGAVAMRCIADDDACKAARVLACEAFAEAQQAPPSSAVLRPFRPDKASACINKAGEVYAKLTITPADRDALDDVCARVFSGSRKDTDAEHSCHNDYECDAGYICDVGFDTCAKKTAVIADAYCNNPGDVCPVDQFCAQLALRRCTERLGADMACDPTNPCESTLRCTAGVCAVRVGLGKTCASNADCLPIAPYCDTFNGSICTGGFTPSTGSKECVDAFGGVDTGGGTGGVSGGGTGGAGGGAAN
jgi:hypothetical protein